MLAYVCVTKRRGGERKEEAGKQAGNREAHSGNRADSAPQGRHRTQQRRKKPRWITNQPEQRTAKTTYSTVQNSCLRSVGCLHLSHMSLNHKCWSALFAACLLVGVGITTAESGNIFVDKCVEYIAMSFGHKCNVHNSNIPVTLGPGRHSGGALSPSVVPPT
jgi:hypothetical protein